MKKGYTLITGGAGFIGSNLADALLRDGERVVIADSFVRPGVRLNADWLSDTHGARVEIEEADIRDTERMRRLVGGAGAIYHLAAQVAVTTSLEDPLSDLQTNLLGTFHILEAARSRAKPPPVLFTSTNKVYGALEDVPIELRDGGYAFVDGRRGINERQPLDFHSPYGCSKGAAEQYVRDYARIFRVPAVVFRMSCIYGRRQFGTEDQGWVAHFARSILAGRPVTIYGDGLQVRDVLWIGDLVAAMRKAVARVERTAGQIYNIGGGWKNAVSVRRVIDRLIRVTGRSVPVRMAPWRPGDQRIYVSDNTKVENALDWRPRTGWESGLERLLEWLRDAPLAWQSELAAAWEEPELLQAAS